MINPNNDELPVYEVQNVQPKPRIALVWLLNLIPYTGAGYLYALGFQKGIKPLFFFWVFMLIFGPGTLIPIYFVLSVLGTAHILNKKFDQKVEDIRLRQTLSSDDYITPVPRGKQLPLSESPEFASVGLRNKVEQTKKRMKKMGDTDSDRSTHALEAFEYKAQAAEKQLRERIAAEQGASAGSSSSSSSSSSPQGYSEFSFAPNVVPESPAASLVADNSQVRFANEGTSVNASNMVPDQNSVLVSSDQSVPDIGAMMVNSDQLLPEFGSLQVDSTQSTPEVASMLFDSTQSTPDVASMLVDSTQKLPEVASQLIDSTQKFPDVSSQLFDSTQTLPDVNSQVYDSTQSLPEVNSQLIDSTQQTPEVASQIVDSQSLNAQAQSPNVSVGDFELPTFSFSFEDHMSAPVSTGNATGSSSQEKCPKCGAARDGNFSFCLACGQSFL